MSRCHGWRITGLVLLLLAAAGSAEAQLVEAVRRGDAEQVRALLRQGADVNAALGDGMTALHWAAQNGDAELARVLVQAGANVHVGTRIGRYTPLHLAAQAGRAEAVKVLLDANSRPNAVTINSGVTPLHLAAASGDAGAISALLGRGADVNARETSWGQTPLTFAAARNRVEAIRLLLQAGADPNAASQSVDSAERERADQAAERMITQMLAEFKRREGGGTEWRPKPSQVQAAIEASREIQLKWPNVDTTSAPGPRAADSASARPAAAAADSAGAKPAAADSAEAKPATGESATAKPTEAASSEAKPEAPAEEEPRPLTYAQLVGGWGGLTPLLHAVRQGHREAVMTLLDGGADINRASEGDQTTPLLMAAVNGQHELGMLLLERGADPNLASAAGTTPLFAVLERQWAPRSSYSHPTEHERQKVTYLEMLGALLEAGADPDVRLKTHLWYMEYTFSVLGGSGINLQGATPFWRAAYALDVEAMRLLLSYGADASIPTTKPPQRGRRPQGGDEETDKSGLPPVPVGGPAIHPIHAVTGVGYGQSFAANAHRHVPEAWLAAVRFLVEEAGADVNARDANGYTSLHHAASRGDNDVILYLVERGADVTAVARSGQTTADMANGPIQRVQPFPETIALLEKLGSKNNHKCLSC